MLRNFFIVLLLLALLAGCGDEGMVSPTLLKSSDDSHYRGTPQKLPENVPAAPSWTPDAIRIDELVFPYAAKQAVGIHDVRGEEFRLASCEVLYKSRRVRRSERENRWVRLSTGQSPPHATHWTHDGVPQFLYIFLKFEDESDYQRFGVGTHADVGFTVIDAVSIGANTWELTLMYQQGGIRASVAETPESRPIANAVIGGGDVGFTADAATGYFWSGSVHLNGIPLTGIAYDTSGLTLRAAIGQRIADMFPTPLRLVLTQKSAPTRDNRFGRRIEFTHANIATNGRYAYIQHANISAEQSKDLRRIGTDIQMGDRFHLYVYKQ